MKVYVILDIEIHDEDKYAEYKRQVPALIEKHGGRYLVRGGPVLALDDWRPERIVMLEFPSPERLQAFIADPEYQPVLAFRKEATTSRTIVVQAHEPDD